MLYSVYKDLVFGTYFVDAMTLIQSQHLFSALINNIGFEAEEEAENTKTFLQSFTAEQSGDANDNRLEGKQIAVHAVRGAMLKHDAMCGPVGMRTIGQRIIESDHQENIIAHIVMFETGGGQSVAVPELTDALSKTTKKTYGFVDGYALSAGQYALSYCDEKWASRATDRLGSIGTMTVFRGRKSGEADQNGQMEFRVYATKSSEKNKEYEDALNKGDVSYVVEQLNEINEQFHQDIKTNYPNVEDKHLTGATFKAEDVVGTLIDGVKSFQQLVDHIGEQYLENNPENSNQNQQTMKQFEKVNSTLGVEALESADGTVALNEEQMEAVNTALVAGEIAQGQIDAAEQAQQAAETAQQDAEGLLATAQARVTELEAGAGAQSAAQIAAADGGNAGQSDLATAMQDADNLIDAYEKQK